MPEIVSYEDAEIPFRPRPAKGASAFVYESVFRTMTDHADRGLEQGTEIMGLMTGAIYKDDLGHYAVVTDSVTSDLDADEASVRFSEGSLEKLFESLDRSDGDVVVGWYHSHPGFGCYLSDTDIKTHTGIFGDDFGLALVIDPTDGSAVMFTCVGGMQKNVPTVMMD